MRVERLFCLERGLVVLAALAAVFAGSILSSQSGRAAGDGTSRSGPGAILDSVLETLNVKTTEGPRPDFVEATRPDPATLKFLPTGAPHPKRATPAKSSDDIEAAKAALDAARDAQLNPKAAAGRKPKVGAKVKKSDQAATGN